MNTAMIGDFEHVFTAIKQHPTVRVVILIAKGKFFLSGLDVKEFSSTFRPDQSDAARKAIFIEEQLKRVQRAVLSVYECRVPVIVGVHSLCSGGGLDFITATDIRYCTKKA